MLQVGEPAGNGSLQTRWVRPYLSMTQRRQAELDPVLGHVVPELSKADAGARHAQASMPAGSVDFYALNASEDGDPVAYFKENGCRFHLLLNADDIEDLHGTFGTPRVFLVDGHKIVRYTLKGTTSREELMTDLRARLAAPTT